MQLDQLAANIRVRKPWEAVDLGFVLVQSWWRTFWLPWFLLLIFIVFILWLLIPNYLASVGLAVLWWLKPLYDRLLLHIFSQNLFGAKKIGLSALAELPQLIKSTGLLGALTFRRFSLSRGFNLPIWQLEKLRGDHRAQRQKLLHTGSHPYAVGLTAACFHLEIIFEISLYGFILLFVPIDHFKSAYEFFFITADVSMPALQLMAALSYALVIFLIEPYYVASSFSLYINKRTSLEAWDIELAFRNMANRHNTLKKHSTTTLVFFISLLLVDVYSGDSKVYAQPSITEAELISPNRLPVDESARVIEEILQNDAFSTQITREVYRLKGFSDDDFDYNNDLFFDTRSSSSITFARLLKAALIIALCVLIFIIIFKRDQWLQWFKPKQEKESYQAPDVLFGMDIRPESLPDDIPSKAKELWQKHQHREALSMLYRGALMRLVNHDCIPLENSHTEGDVLKLTASKINANRQSYLEMLTKSWQKTAYAHRIPEESIIEELIAKWQTEFVEVVDVVEVKTQ